MAAAIPFPKIRETTMPATSQKLLEIVCPIATGTIRRPVTMKKIGMKRVLPKNTSFSFAGCPAAAALTAQPAKKAPTMSGAAPGAAAARPCTCRDDFLKQHRLLPVQPGSTDEH